MYLKVEGDGAENAKLALVKLQILVVNVLITFLAAPFLTVLTVSMLHFDLEG